jgi:hypothetical protein
MPESLYRRSPSPDSNFEATVTNRSNMLKSPQTIYGDSIQMRNPAWVKLSGKCNMCGGGRNLTVPIEQADWDALYSLNGLKPKPILQNVSITYGGDWGLAQKLTANIKCFDRDTFKHVREAFLMPGNDITVEFGYSTSKKWNSREQDYNVVKGFRVATFSFSAGDDGTWIGSFTAIASAEAIKSIETMQELISDGLQYKIAGEIEGEEIVDVASIGELIDSDAQRNGKDSMNRVDETNTGYVISQFEKYEATDKDNMVASMVIYTSNHLSGNSNSGGWSMGVFDFMNPFRSSSVESTKLPHQIYVTLGYVIDRIINTRLKPSAEKAVGGDDKDKFAKLKIKFHKDYSRCKLPPMIESGDPTSMLILGGGAAFRDSDLNLVDFNDLQGQEEGSASDVWAQTGQDVRLDKILIHKDAVIAALGMTASSEENESETVDPKDTKDTVIDLNAFLKKIFKLINECTGGAIALRLVLDPDDELRETFLVVDQNYGGDAEIPCFVFNPIDGDGSTISCNISSNGGSNTYRTSMYLANSKKGDVAARLRNCEGELKDGRDTRRSDAEERWHEIAESPGTMIKDRFNSKQIDSFKGVMASLYRYSPKPHEKWETINWPGMEIDLTIHGAWGIIPGCAVATTQMPDEWRVGGKNIYFMVTEVTHNFEQSTWETSIRGIMSFYHNLREVKL